MNISLRITSLLMGIILLAGTIVIPTFAFAANSDNQMKATSNKEVAWWYRGWGHPYWGRPYGWGGWRPYYNYYYYPY